MIKFILPNHEHYFHKCDTDTSIKENLNNFCKEKGLLSEIYEAYDPVKYNVLDSSKKLLDYDLNSIHLRQVNSNFDSIQSNLEQLNCTINSDKLYNDQSIRTYSQNSYNQNQLENLGKKPRKGLMYRFRKYIPKRGKNMSRSYSESLESPVANNMVTLSTDQIYQESLKTEIISTEMKNNQKTKKTKKRNAPPPPMKDIITFYFEDHIDTKSQSIELVIPLPPTDCTELSGYVNYYPWQSCIESYTGQSNEDDSIYSVISEDPFPLSPGSHVFETPRCPTPKDTSDDGRESPDYIYSKIVKNITKNHDSDKNNKSLFNENLNEVNQHQSSTQIPKEKISLISDVDVTDIPSFSIPFPIPNSNNKTIFNGPIISTDSDGSSISSINNDVFVETNTDYNSQSQKIILIDSLNKMTTNVEKGILSDCKQTSKDSNSKTENIRSTNTLKQENNKDQLLPSLVNSSSAEKGFAKTFEHLHDDNSNENIVKKNSKTGQQFEVTDSNKIMKSNPSKPFTKPHFKINNGVKMNADTNKSINKPKNPFVQIYDNEKMNIKKQGQSLYFSAKPNPKQL